MNDSIVLSDFLQSLDISLDNNSYNELVSSFENSLMSNVTDSIADQLDDNQLLQLKSLLDNQNDEALQSWLVNNVPNLKEIVQDEVDILLGDIAEKNDQL